MIKYKGRGGVSKFLMLAVAEHIVIILLFAIFVYQRGNSR